MIHNEGEKTITDVYPFDNSCRHDLDIILCSSDGVLFYVNKVILSLTSPVFEEMISRNPPPSSTRGFKTLSNPPIFHLDDKSNDLLQLLMWCDPRGVPTMKFDSFKAALRLADKYAMDTILLRFSNAMEFGQEMIKKDPIRVYAVAIRYSLLDVAKIAAKYSLGLKAHEIVAVEELAHISGAALQNLYTYRLACTGVAKSLVTASCGKWIGGVKCGSCRSRDRILITKYRDQLQIVLSETPTGEQALNTDLIDPVLTATCEVSTSKEAFLRFAKQLCLDIDAAVRKVSYGYFSGRSI